MKIFLAFLFVFSSFPVFSQGELMRIGESGGAIYYGTFKAQVSRYRPDERVHLMGFSIVGNRVAEGGFSVSKLKDDLSFVPYIAGYLNSDYGLNLKGAVAYNFVESGNFPSLSGTMFINSESMKWLVPSINLTLSKEVTSYGGGLDFRLGNDFGLIGGVFVFKSADIDLTYGLNFGIMFTNGQKPLPKEI